MNCLIGVATLEEFLDLFRVLWFVRPLAYLLLLSAVIRLGKQSRLPAGGGFLMVGFGLLIVGELMGAAMDRSWIEIAYSPSYAAMMKEWEMGEPSWKWWEPVYWWMRSVCGWLGLVTAGVGFVVAGRALARRALAAQLGAGNLEPGGHDGG